MTLLNDMTPTEDLFCEVLAGRFRTGERSWTFSAMHTRTAKSLEAKGMIWWKHAIIERHIVAGLTDEGKAAFLDPEYTGPGTSAPATTQQTFGYCAECGGAIVYHDWCQGQWTHVNNSSVIGYDHKAAPNE